MFEFWGLYILKILRVRALVTSLTVTAVIRFDGLGICITALVLRLTLTRMREFGGLVLWCQLGI